MELEKRDTAFAITTNLIDGDIGDYLWMPDIATINKMFKNKGQKKES
jgi:hypothetical protein